MVVMDARVLRHRHGVHTTFRISVKGRQIGLRIGVFVEIRVLSSGLVSILIDRFQLTLWRNSQWVYSVVSTRRRYYHSESLLSPIRNEEYGRGYTLVFHWEMENSVEGTSMGLERLRRESRIYTNDIWTWLQEERFYLIVFDPPKPQVFGYWSWYWSLWCGCHSYRVAE